MKNKYAFTLIEIIIVISVIGILTTLTIFGINIVRARARDSARVADLNRVKGALLQYFIVEKNYPLCSSANYYICYGQIADSFNGRYLNPLPTDPVNKAPHSYAYNVDNPSETFALWVKLEKLKSTDDGGSYDDYFETGSGDNWPIKVSP